MTGTLLADRAAAVESGLATAVIDTLLREDYAGLAGRVRETAAGPVLDWPGGPVLPLRPDGFLADFAVAGPAPLTLGSRRSHAAVPAISTSSTVPAARTT